MGQRYSSRMAERLPPDPVIEAYKKGVDRTLLLENLRKTPDERVRAMISMMELGEELRASIKRHDP